MARRSKKKFTEYDAQILRNVVINREKPGTILKDLNSLVEYIQTRKITITKSTNYFSLKYLEPINEILSNPIKIKLKRPQKKSFPNIMGLFLLLRSIGLLKFQQINDKKYVQIDNTVLNLWSNLNNTEAYFTLLEAWLIRTDPKDLLDEFSSLYGILLTTCFEFWTQIPQNGLKVEKEKAESFKYFPGLYNISLLELFGLIDLLHGEPETGKGWKIDKIKRNEFGDAFFRYMYESLINAKDYYHFSLYNATEIKYKIPFGQLQTYFEPFFPEWKSNLNIPQPEYKDGTHIFKVSLENAWRSIGIESEMFLEDLADVILGAFEFDKDHLYAFYLKDRFGNSLEINCPFSDDAPFTTEVKIGELPIEIGSLMKFVFDFGDYWEFMIQLQDIRQTDIKLEHPKIMETHGKAPEQYPDWDEDDDEDF
jgi:hypothetical protein